MTQKGVDLTLAINYVPACLCLCKAILLLLTIAVMPPKDEIGAFTLVAFALYLDRLVTRPTIFDANAILLAAFFANVHASIRAVSTILAVPVFVWLFHLSWAMSCLCALAEPGQFREWFERRTLTQKYGPTLVMVTFVACLTYVHHPREGGFERFCRGLAFTLLSLGWIYIVGVRPGKHQRTPESLKDTSAHFISRLAPVLYSPLAVSGLFAILAAAGLVYQHLQQPGEAYQSVPQKEENEEPDPEAAVSQAQQEPPAADESETAAEDLFRLAKLQQASLLSKRT